MCIPPPLPVVVGWPCVALILIILSSVTFFCTLMALLCSHLARVHESFSISTFLTFAIKFFHFLICVAEMWSKPLLRHWLYQQTLLKPPTAPSRIGLTYAAGFSRMNHLNPLQSYCRALHEWVGLSLKPCPEPPDIQHRYVGQSACTSTESCEKRADFQ